MDVDVLKRKTRAAYEYHTQSPHMKLKVTSWLTVTAENMINNIHDIKHKYMVCQEKKYTWYCVCHPSHPKPLSNCKYPLFKRVRRVVYKNGNLTYSCPYQHTYGIPCLHLIKVLDTLPGYPGITHHDVSVSWWKLYHMMMFESQKGEIDPNYPYGEFLK